VQPSQHWCYGSILSGGGGEVKVLMCFPPQSQAALKNLIHANALSAGGTDSSPPISILTHLCAQGLSALPPWREGLHLPTEWLQGK
jgi:hypothetical protein